MCDIFIAINIYYIFKRIHIENDFVWLVPENPKYRRIKVTPDQNFMVWGVVTYSIKDVRGK